MPEQVKKDEKRTECLQKMGFDMIRISNFDINDNFYGVCTKIDEIIKSKVSPHPPSAPSPQVEGKASR